MSKVNYAFLFIFTVFLFYQSSQCVAASNDVNISVRSEHEQYSKKMNADIIIKFNNLELYNDKLFLSYHLYDKDNQQLSWEGQRFPIIVDDNGVSNIDLKLDLTSGLEPLTKDYAIIKFDIVDEKNVYWYSTNSEISFVTEEIIYKSDTFKRYISILKGSFINSPIVFIVNVLFFLLFIVGVMKIRKSQLFIK